jgi:hypothetical protein
MSDERDEERGDRPTDEPGRDDGTQDGSEPTDRPRDERESAPGEPLGDLAAEVRERRGGRAPDGESRRERLSDGERRSDRQTGSKREGPLADVAAAVDERRSRKRDDADAFESVEVGDLDGERLWEQLAAGDDGPTVAVASEAAADASGSTDRGDASEDRDVRTIPKATCHGCPHLGDPPELACTREGTDILAMVDTDHFRVADCPMVVDGEEDIGSITAESDDDGVS